MLAGTETDVNHSRTEKIVKTQLKFFQNLWDKWTICILNTLCTLCYFNYTRRVYCITSVTHNVATATRYGEMQLGKWLFLCMQTQIKHTHKHCKQCRALMKGTVIFMHSERSGFQLLRGVRRWDGQWILWLPVLQCFDRLRWVRGTKNILGFWNYITRLHRIFAHPQWSESLRKHQAGR